MAAKGNQAVDACASMYLSMHVCVCADFSASHIQRGKKKEMCTHLNIGLCLSVSDKWSLRHSNAFSLILHDSLQVSKMPHLECRQNLEMNPTELGRETENVSGLKSSEH